MALVEVLLIEELRRLVERHFAPLKELPEDQGWRAERVYDSWKIAIEVGEDEPQMLVETFRLVSEQWNRTMLCEMSDVFEVDESESEGSFSACSNPRELCCFKLDIDADGMVWIDPAFQYS